MKLSPFLSSFSSLSTSTSATPSSSLHLLHLPKEILIQIILTCGFSTSQILSQTCSSLLHLINCPSTFLDYDLYSFDQVVLEVHVETRIHSFDQFCMGIWETSTGNGQVTSRTPPSHPSSTSFPTSSRSFSTNLSLNPSLQCKSESPNKLPSRKEGALLFIEHR